MKRKRMPQLSPSMIRLLGKLREGEKLRVVEINGELHVYLVNTAETVRKSSFKVLLRNGIISRVSRPKRKLAEGIYAIRKEKENGTVSDREV